MKALSTMAESIKPSLTRTLFDMARAYDDVIDFTLGDPDLPTHQAIKDAGCLAIQEGKTRYAANAGLPQLRKAITASYLLREKLQYRPESEVMVTVGAMEGLYLALLSITNPGDEYIIPAPYYINYLQMVQMCGGRPVVVDGSSSDPFSFSIERIEAAITPRTKAIILNSPTNPSGRVVPQSVIEQLAALAMKYDLYVLSDEVYRCLIYDDVGYRSIAAIDGMRQRTIVINSLSKEFCMTGWRIGYVLANSDIVSNMTRLQENICACAPLPSQYAAIEALSRATDFSSAMRADFARRRDMTVAAINAIHGLTCTSPQATFYLMVDITHTGLTSYAFAVQLLQTVNVAVAPGISYGQSYDHYIRLAFTLPDDSIRQGIGRIAQFMQQFT